MTRKINGFRTAKFNLKMECWLHSMPYDREGCHATGTAIRCNKSWWYVYQDSDGLYFYAR